MTQPNNYKLGIQTQAFDHQRVAELLPSPDKAKLLAVRHLLLMT